jgi:arginine/lysine/ornithine decarboxylase
MNQAKTPLLDAVVNHLNKNSLSLHVPGHKNGQVFSAKGYSYFKEILKLDVTELTGLDNLHEPEEAIKEAEELLADLYGAKQSFFLVNGSTVGNLTMILSACNNNEQVIVQRNCHKSIMNGLILAGAKPVFLTPEYDEEAQVPTYVKIKTIVEALEAHPDAKAIILTNPNYYGHSFDLKDIVKLAHKKGIPVLVDEAHGAHFGLGEPFPDTAIKSGADLVVQSAHKTLPAMTMGSYLHYQSNLIPLEKVNFYLRSLQSSSPSYPIMVSLDLARAFIANLKVNGGAEQIFKEIMRFRDDLNQIPQICTVHSNDQAILEDPLKIIIQSRCHLTGYEIQAIFENAGLYTELADFHNVLCIMPLANIETKQLLSKIETAMKKIRPLPVSERRPIIINQHVQSVAPFSFSELKSIRIKKINIADSVKKISAQSLVPYPPGIPLILQGEIITDEHLRQLKMLINHGAKIQGLHKEINIYDC